MAQGPPPEHQDLVDYLLEQMSTDDAAAFEARAADDDALAALVSAGRDALTPLDALTPPAVSATLVDDVMARVASTEALGVRGVDRSSDSPLAGEFAGRPRGILSLGESLAIAASIALIITFSVPGVASLRARQLQARCGTNLASLAGGLTAYAHEFDGAMPAVASGPGTNWLRRKNIRHMQPALKIGVIQPSYLTCPTGRPAPERVRDFGRFFGQATVTFYSAQNATGPVIRLRGRFNVPLVADPNPMIFDGEVHADEAGQSNSNAHRGRGQNVALPDGSASFLTSPIFDERDNIWQAENVDRYTGVEAQSSATDAFLIP